MLTPIARSDLYRRIFENPRGNCQCCESTEHDADSNSIESMLDDFSVAQKMQWASKRTTTREEDIAYCLMGLFDVNMPLLYGEGPKAFFRLQKAILEMRSDHSILAFRYSSNQFDGKAPPSLAPDPTVFRDDVRNIYTSARNEHMSLSGSILSIDMLICPTQVKARQSRDMYLGILDCSMSDDPHMIPAILLKPAVSKDDSIFRRTYTHTNLFWLHSGHPGAARVRTDTGYGSSMSTPRSKPYRNKSKRDRLVTIQPQRHQTLSNLYHQRNET